MATSLGAHADRIGLVRDLISIKGRKAQGKFAFEGATLLDEAMRSGIVIDDIFATQPVYESNRNVRALEAGGTPVFIVDERSAAKISDLETPTGLVATARIAAASASEMFAGPGLVLALADLNDPGNAGTLLRSAEAFGATGVVFGELGVDPYHPKVVRGAMGAIFRVRLCVSGPGPFRQAAHTAGATVYGLRAGGETLNGHTLPRTCALIVGHERRGLGPWEAACDRFAAIPMVGPTESLNAAVAGSIALYEASKREDARR